MFENLGAKIKLLAIISTIAGIIISIVIGFVFISHVFLLRGFLVMVVGCFLSWIGSFTSYAIGETLENTEKLLYKTQELLSKPSTPPHPQSTIVKEQTQPSTIEIKPITYPTPAQPTISNTITPILQQEQQYLFALQMMERRSYDIAYNALVKIKGYKNVDELIAQLENKNQ